jgi:hypothetical protein
MLLAMLLFVQQAAIITVSQALASIGLMRDPAVVLNGPAHFHGGLAGNVHVHGDKNGVGHVHNAVDTDDDDDDVNGAGHAPIWSFGYTAAVIPPMNASALAFKVIYVGQCHHERGEGVEPDGMQRPPSTPNMG